MVGMKLNQILLISPLIVLAGLSAYLLSEEAWCINDECESNFYWVGWFIGLYIVFYGIPVTGYLIYRKLRQKKKEKVSSAIS